MARTQPRSLAHPRRDLNHGRAPPTVAGAPASAESWYTQPDLMCQSRETTHSASEINTFPPHDMATPINEDVDTLANASIAAE